jgi:hypothetical protein
VGTEALVGPLLMVYTTTYGEIGCDSRARLPGPTAGTQVGNRNCIHDKNPCVMQSLHISCPSCSATIDAAERFSTLCLGHFARDNIPLQVGIVFLGEWHLGSLGHLFLVLLEHGLVDLDFRWGKGRRGNEVERLVANKLASEPARIS